MGEVQALWGSPGVVGEVQVMEETRSWRGPNERASCRSCGGVQALWETRSWRATEERASCRSCGGVRKKL